ALHASLVATDRRLAETGRAGIALSEMSDCIFHEDAFGAIGVRHEAWRPIAEHRIDVILPEIRRLGDMSVGINRATGAGHGSSFGDHFGRLGRRRPFGSR